MKISACLITRNAAAHLDRCLASLDWCDEILVRDQASEDETLEICARHGARVVQGEWLGFGPSKAAAVAETRHRWVLSVDADEVVDDRLRAAILALPDDPMPAAYRINRLSRFLGRWIRHCGWHPDPLVRLFDKQRAGFDDRPVHEAIHARGPVEDLEGLLLHFTYDSVEQYLAKMDHYTTLGAEVAVASGRRTNLLSVVIRPKMTFLRTYILQRGFMDGGHGLALCTLMSVQTFVKYLKIWKAGRGPEAGSERR